MARKSRTSKIVSNISTGLAATGGNPIGGVVGAAIGPIVRGMEHLGKMSKHAYEPKPNPTPKPAPKPTVKKRTQTIMGNIRKRNQALKDTE